MRTSYEQQQLQPTYQHTPLTGLWSIRLLTLHPASFFSAPIKCELHATHLVPQKRDTLGHPSLMSFVDETQWMPEEFEAVSYTWDDDEPSCTISFPDDSVLLIRPNLDSFLRHRREDKRAVKLWIDSVCIDQSDVEERNVQVRNMHRIYLAAKRLTVWLGSAHSDSDIAMETLSQEGAWSETPFDKLPSIESRALRAIESLLSRRWWTRVWIIQEVGWGGAGIKLPYFNVRCGRKTIGWTTLVIACAKMKMSRDMWRQSLPRVENVLELDEVLTRIRFAQTAVLTKEQEIDDLTMLLSLVVRYRPFHATDPRDSIFALMGLLPARNYSATTELKIDYGISKNDVYIDFAYKIIERTKSLEVLRHCRGASSDSSSDVVASSWVPDWSVKSHIVPLPSGKRREEELIPWWSLPRTRDDGVVEYAAGNSQEHLRDLAREVIKPSVRFDALPAYPFDLMPDDKRAKFLGYFRDMINRPDCVVMTLDEGDPLAGEEIGGEEGAQRRMEYNEKATQRSFLKTFLRDKHNNPPEYNAGIGSNMNDVMISLSSKELTVSAMIWDTLREVQDTFTEDLNSDWTDSTRLMVAIGECKRQAMKSAGGNYGSIEDAAFAFWKTIFAGQTISSKDCLKWLPQIPETWKARSPALTGVNPGQVELAETARLIQTLVEMLSQDVQRSGSFQLRTTTGVVPGSLEPSDWSEDERAKHISQFEELGELWHKQPFDLYHRPFQLPSVIPDPYWEDRRRFDKLALKQSSESRRNRLIPGIYMDDAEERRQAQILVNQEMKKEPSLIPQAVEPARLGEYALGRRFFITKKGYFGLGPKECQNGDLVVVILGVDVPFVLRKSLSGYYQMVGETYVHGIMKGEALEDWKLGKKEIRKLTLR